MSSAPLTPPSPQINLSPLVYISYSHKDDEWLQLILTQLQPMVEAREIRLFYDGKLTPGDQWDETLQANLSNASLGIVLLSADWLASEYPTTKELPAMASRRIIPVLVGACDWSKSEVGRFYILMSNGKPLSDVGPAERDMALRALPQLVRSSLAGPSRTDRRLSREAQEIRDLARQFAISSAEPRLIDAPCLIYAFLERGRQDTGLVRTPQFLWGAIPEAGRSRFEDLRRQRLGSLTVPALADLPEGPVFDNAAALSRDTLAGGEVHARHLLAAALVDADAEQLLVELAAELATIRDAFLVFVLKAFPEEPRHHWANFLGAKSEPAPGKPDSGPLADARVIASYQSEDWTGRDLLNITRDVNALAALAAGWNVQPPLSIGLFGEWGSGKSFFMREMRKRVKRLATAAQLSDKPQRECAYYKNIAQIEFNAWHYMEGDNLWACLVEHIFSNLGLPQDTTAAQVEERQKQILEQIGAKKSLEEQAAARRQALETRKISAERKANDARTELDSKKAALEQEQSALWNRIEGELSREAVDVLKSIPVTAQLRDSAEAVRKLTQDARTLSGRAGLLWRLLRHDPQRRSILYWMLGGSAIMFGLVRLAYLAPELQRLLTPAVQAVVPVAAALAATAGKFRAVLGKIGHVVSFFEEKNQEISEAVSRAEKAQQRQIATLENDVRTLSQDIDQAVQEQQQHQAAIANLEKELAATDASRLLAEFIRSRADADDYRKHLGMVALVRRDFERLSDLFRSQRKDEQLGKERRDDNTVNRILLYVDDLDRCPPETVVNVLQAIHLLLAFPIFVVVVAVDSRWVSRSLERCYDWLVSETLPDPAAQTGPGGMEGTRYGLGATAHDYLEKIFQIPFWLAPMDTVGCQSMIRGLTQAISQEQATLREAIAMAKKEGPQVKPSDASGGVPVGTPVPAQPRAGASQPMGPAPAPIPPTPAVLQPAADESKEPEDIDMAPRQLDVEEAEIWKIDELAVLIGRSPRVAKRFLNCYRLLKARMDETELQDFLAGRFQDVMEVLGVIVGAPTIAREVMAALSADGAGDGKSLIQQLTKDLAPGALSVGEGAEVVRLLSSASPDHLKSLRSVVPLVSRFSFSTHGDNAVIGPKRGQKKVWTAAV